MSKHLKISLKVIFLILAGFLLTYRVQATDATPTADTNPKLTLLWQTAFNKDSVLIEPDYVTVDGEGNCYVGQLSSGVMKKFDASGQFVMAIEMKTMDLTGIAIDSDDNILLVGWDSHHIQKFDQKGKFVAEFGAKPDLLGPSIAIDPNDNLYTLVLGEIHKFDSTGKFLLNIGSLGSADGQLGDAGDGGALAVDADGNVYTTDPENRRIVKFSPNGQFLANFILPDDGKPVDAGLVFSHGHEPFGVAVDGDGNVYASTSHFLRKFDAKGQIIAQWPTTEGELNRAGRVALNKDGDIYVVAESEVTGVDGNTLKALVLKKFQQSER